MPSNNRPSTRKRPNNKARASTEQGLVRRVSQSPTMAALAAGGTVAAALFIWSRRNRVSEQISNLSEQLGDFREKASLSGHPNTMPSALSGKPATSRPRRTQAEIAQEALTLKQLATTSIS